jgi:hypothetical protein
MPEYRTYRIGIDGEISSVTHLTCDDDADAIAEARQLTDGFAIRLWRANRLVKKFRRKKP